MRGNKGMKNVIELRKLSKVYKDVTVNLEKITVREGEIYGFLGPNGAGKTTTMKMVLSLVTPTSGEILVNGQNVKKDKTYLNKIGSMIEEPSYYPNLTGYENLLVFQKMVGLISIRLWSWWVWPKKRIEKNLLKIILLV